MRRLPAAVLLLVLACAPAQEAGEQPSGAAPYEQPKHGGVLHFPVRQPMDNLDPYAGFGASRTAINGGRYESLTSYKRVPERDHRIDFEIVPLLAERWEQRGPTTFVFHLRKDVKWHDGQEMTAEDVVTSLSVVNDPKNGYVSRRSTEQAISAKALDRHTVEFHLRKENSSFLGDFQEFLVIPKHVIERGDSLTKVSVGTGPFKVTDFDTRAGFAMARNPGYWDAPRPYPDGVVGHYGLDDAGMLAAFAARQTDLLTVEGNQLEVVKASVPDARVNQFMAAFGNSLYFRADKEPYTDIRVRRALHLALDRQAMLDTITGGRGVMNPPGFNGQKEGYAWSQEELRRLPGWNPATKQQDIAEAKRLLADAGYPNGFSDKLLFSKSTSTTPPIAEMAVSQLKNALNVNLTLEGMDAAVYQSRDVKSEYNVQMALVARMELNVAERFHSKSVYNTAKIADPELDRLIEQFDASAETSQRKALVREIQRVLQEKMYAVPTIENPFFPLSHAWIKNYNFSYGQPHAIPWWQGSDTWIDIDLLPANRRGEAAKLAGR